MTEALGARRLPPVSWVVNYPVISFTLAFLFCFRTTIAVIIYHADKTAYLNAYRLELPMLLGVSFLAFFIQWLFAVFFIWKHPEEKLRDKLYRHPILTCLMVTNYLVNIPLRLKTQGFDGSSWTGLTLLMNVVHIFETAIFYGLIDIAWWFLFCWISDKVIRRQLFQGVFYKRVIDSIIPVAPLIYKIVLGLMVGAILTNAIIIGASELSTSFGIKVLTP